jgi:hypothetical protein
MLQAYVVNVSSVSDVCCSKCFMLQVVHEQARERGVGGGSPLRRSGPRVRAGCEAGATAPMCMCTAAAGACERILVLGLGVHSIECASMWDHARTGDRHNVECALRQDSGRFFFL